MVTDEDKVASQGKDATTSISESVHASSTVGLGIAGTIRLDHVTAEGQTRSNNDFGRGHERLVRGLNKSEDVNDRVFGTFHQLPEELRRSLILFGKENASKSRKRFDEALASQREASRRKEEIALQKKLDQMQGDYIVAIYFYEQYHSSRCWLTIMKADENYKKLGSKGKRLKSIKEQLLMRSLGLGWNEAYHAWSKDGIPYKSNQLFSFFKQCVIPLAETRDVPREPPLSLPSPPEMSSLGTKSEIALSMESKNESKLAEFKVKAYSERDKREEDGIGDRWSEMQRSVMPDIDATLVGFRIEKLFEYNETDGTPYLNWCHGQVVSVNGDKIKYATIRWDEECLRPRDRSTTREKLLQTKWNPAQAKAGAWREYLVK